MLVCSLLYRRTLLVSTNYRIFYLPANTYLFINVRVWVLGGWLYCVTSRPIPRYMALHQPDDSMSACAGNSPHYVSGTLRC